MQLNKNMTAKETLENTFDLDKYKTAGGVYHQTEEAVIGAMQEYAKIKCKELLEIAADKAETKELFVNGTNGDWYDKVGKVDKDSILNVVDLESFCS